MKKLDRAFKKVNIKGKEYIEVKERILALVENEEPYSIETEYQYFDSRKMWVVKATLTMKTTGEVFTGLAQEIESDDYKSVNSTSALENAETSAVGRACAFAGIGVIDSIASADEVNKAINRGSNFGNGPKTDTQKKWLNYDIALDYIEAGNTTPDKFKKTVLDDGYSISQAGGEAMKHYFDTGELVKDMFFKK